MATNNNRILSVDVECVATGYGHDNRSPCSVAIVDDKCQIIFSSLIKPIEKVVSDLYVSTGLRIKDLDQAPSLEEIYPLFDSTTIIVGQSPKNDLKWLKLEKGVHYSQTIDISEWFQAYTPRYRPIFFSLAHESFVLLNIDLNAQNGHLATQDARASMQLYLKYKDNDKGREGARRLLCDTPMRMTPAKACNYNYEGVCLAGFNRKMCTCSRPPLESN